MGGGEEEQETEEGKGKATAAAVGDEEEEEGQSHFKWFADLVVVANAGTLAAVGFNDSITPILDSVGYFASVFFIIEALISAKVHASVDTFASVFVIISRYICNGKVREKIHFQLKNRPARTCVRLMAMRIIGGMRKYKEDSGQLKHVKD